MRLLSSVLREPLAEELRTRDDDCNGMIDDGVPATGTCTAGVGECAKTGQVPCSGGMYQGCNVNAGAPSGYHASAGPNGTCDWNCDGSVKIAGLSGTALTAAGDGCPLTGFAATTCSAITNATTCALQAKVNSYCRTTGDALSKVGSSVESLHCAWSTQAGTCNPSSWASRVPAEQVACE